MYSVAIAHCYGPLSGIRNKVACWAVSGRHFDEKTVYCHRCWCCALFTKLREALALIVLGGGIERSGS